MAMVINIIFLLQVRPLLLPQHFSGGVEIRQLPVLSSLLQDMQTTVIWIVLVAVLYIRWHAYLLIAVVYWWWWLIMSFFAGNSYYRLVLQWWQCTLSCS